MKEVKYFYLKGDIKEFIKAHPEFKGERPSNYYEAYCFLPKGIKYGMNLLRKNGYKRFKFSFIQPLHTLCIAKLVELGMEGWITIESFYETKNQKKYMVSEEDYLLLQKIKGERRSC